MRESGNVGEIDPADPADPDRSAGSAATPDAVDPAAGRAIGRRIVLGLVGLGAVGVLTGRLAQNAAVKVLAPLEVHDPTGLLSLLPVGDTFRFYSVAGGVRTETAATYQLKIGGLVDHPRTLSLADLAAMPQTELTRDFQCVTGWRVPQVPWSGVRLADLLESAGVQSGATAVRFGSFDGVYSESLTLDQARADDTLVALRMLDADVTHDHGGPVRLYVAPMYGYKSLKWLSEIELTATVQSGYWEHRGYSVDGFVGESNGQGVDEHT